MQALSTPLIHGILEDSHVPKRLKPISYKSWRALESPYLFYPEMKRKQQKRPLPHSYAQHCPMARTRL